MRECMEWLYFIVYLIVGFCAYLLTMNYVFQIPFCKGKRRWGICIGLFFMIHFPVAFLYDIDASTGVLFVTMGIASCVLLKEKISRILVLHLSVYFAYSTFAAVMITVLSYVCKASEQELLATNWIPLLMDSIPPAILLANRYLKKRNQNETEITLQSQQIVFMLVGAAGVYAVMGLMQILGRETEGDSFLAFTRVVVTLVCFLFLVLVFWQGVVVNRQNQMAERMRISALIDRMKEEYFQEITARDETMRKFRHDYRAHMIALKGYCEQGEQEEMSAYLNRLLETGAKQSMKNYVGDAGVNAVINHLAERAEQEGIRMTIEGICRRPARVDSFDLSCVFSNILTNAIEACERLESGAQKRIHLQLQEYNEVLVLHLSNAAPTGQAEGITWKEDKQNHGLGMGNVRRIVEKYEGRISVSDEDGVYTTDIVL